MSPLPEVVRLDWEYQALESMLRSPPSPDTVRLALSQAKRVRREVNALVRSLASERDRLDDTLG